MLAVKKFQTLLVSAIIVTASSAFAEISIYQSTDNTGLNKQERIEAVEKYLFELSNSLRKMESKIDDNTKEIKAIDEAVKVLKAAQAKNTETSLGEKKASTIQEKSEIDKIKADILVLKNQDIEKLKVNFEDLSDTVKALQSSFRSLNN
jgi:hypothetical protein